MTIEQGIITFVNIENFEKFLKENLKEEFANDLIFDLQEYIDDLVSQHAASGANDYELDSSYTKSGHPKCISFEYHLKKTRITRIASIRRLNFEQITFILNAKTEMKVIVILSIPSIYKKFIS